jgi:hypothetical protein
MGKIRIRDKHPGSATLGKKVPLRFPVRIFCFIFAAVFLYRMSYLFQAFVSVIPRRKGAEEKEDSDT